MLGSGAGGNARSFAPPEDNADYSQSIFLTTAIQRRRKASPMKTPAEQVNGGHDRNQRDDALRNDAIETPNLQNRRLNVGEIERKSQAGESENQRPSPFAKKRQQC